MTGTSQYFIKACEAYHLPAPTPEYQFDPKRKWRIDYYFEHNGRRVALEVEGGVWTNGRHTRPKGFLADMEKYNAMACAGILLLRTTPEKLLTTETFTNIKNCIYGEF